jgi:hypothetical protein
MTEKEEIEKMWEERQGKRKEYLKQLTDEKPEELVIKHRYVKNFAHLIAIINNAFEHKVFKDYLKNHEVDLDNVCMDPNFYYKYVYKRPYCDQFTWLITHDRPDLLIKHVLDLEVRIYNRVNRFCGKLYGNLVINVPKELRDK